MHLPPVGRFALGQDKRKSMCGGSFLLSSCDWELGLGRPIRRSGYAAGRKADSSMCGWGARRDRPERRAKAKQEKKQRTQKKNT